MTMAEAKRNITVIIFSAVSCIVTCIVTIGSCGIMVGSVQADVRHHSEKILEISAKMETETSKIHEILKIIIKDQSDQKEKQAFLEGTVVTKIDNISAYVQELRESVSKIDKQIDDLMLVDERGE